MANKVNEQNTIAPLTKPEWDALHDKLFQQTKDKFFESLEQFDGFNWPVPRLVHWVLSYYGKTPDHEMIEAIRTIQAEADAEEAPR